VALSAGILVLRAGPDGPEVLLAHPGGPLWVRRDAGAWMIPKGLVEPGETALQAALREFTEETGLTATGDFRPLKPIRQAGGKQVLCWTVEDDLDIAGFRPGTFEMEWPPKSGRTASFPEIDRIAWFGAEAALEKILPSQAPLIREALGLAA
jgi:predicted NUDIX family NTP pyrophosphohydrolase